MQGVERRSWLRQLVWAYWALTLVLLVPFIYQLILEATRVSPLSPLDAQVVTETLLASLQLVLPAARCCRMVAVRQCGRWRLARPSHPLRYSVTSSGYYGSAGGTKSIRPDYRWREHAFGSRTARRHSAGHRVAAPLLHARPFHGHAWAELQPEKPHLLRRY